MRINDIVSENQIDELNAQDVGQAAAKGAKALGKGVKASISFPRCFFTKL